MRKGILFSFLMCLCVAGNACSRPAKVGIYGYVENSSLGDRCQQVGSPYAAMTAGNSTAVPVGEAIAINAMQANVADFPELKLGQFKVGDIAIVANVGERSSYKREYGEGAARGGRVVFFQENAVVKNHLNLSNLPLYGPKRYEGLPLDITLQVIELDGGERAVSRAVLPGLVALSRTALGASPQLAQFLDSVGSKLISNNKDDIVIEYHLELDPPAASGGFPTPSLRYGNYVYISHESPTASLTLGGVYHNASDGRLYSDRSCKTPIQDRTWLTFQIKRADPAHVIAADESVLLEALRQDLGKDRADAVATAVGVVKTLKEERETGRLYDGYLALVQAQAGVAPANILPTAKAQLGDMLAEMNKHFTGDSTAKLTAYRVRVLLTHLRNIRFHEDETLSKDAARVFHYEFFKLDAARQALGL